MPLIKLNEKKDRVEAEPILKYMDRQMINNKTFVVAAVGPIGSGKSYFEMRLAELWYKKRFNERFPQETNVCFGVNPFLERLSDINNPNRSLRKGDILVLEEAGVNVGSRDFMQKSNKAINYVVQSFRSLNIICFVNLPHLSMLDKSVRMLLTAVFEMAGINKQKKKSYVKPYFLQVNQNSGKIYRKWLRLKDKKTKQVVKIKRIEVSKPSPSLTEPYEERKRKFIAETIREGLKKSKTQAKSEERSILDTGTAKQREAKRLFVECDGNTKKTAKELGISVRSVEIRLGGREIMADLRVIAQNPLEKPDFEVNRDDSLIKEVSNPIN